MAISLPIFARPPRPRRRTRLPDPATAARWPSETSERVLREARRGNVASAYLLRAAASLDSSIAR